jgi:integration host factor subunit beta
VGTPLVTPFPQLTRGGSSPVDEGWIGRRNFSEFKVREGKPRKARNPHTGDSMTVPEKAAVTFKRGLEMERQVAQATRGGLG